MVYLNSYSEFNESWKNIIAGALIGLTTACQKPDLEDEFGRKLLASEATGLATVTFVDSLDKDKFRIEAKFNNNDRVIYFDNHTKLDTGQTVYLHNDDIGRLLITPVPDDFEIPNKHDKISKSYVKIGFDGKVTNNLSKWNKIEISRDNLNKLLSNLESIKSKHKSKYIAVQIDPNGNVLSSKEIKSLRGIKPQSNLVILRGRK